jgi:hypothetical protein
MWGDEEGAQRSCCPSLLFFFSWASKRKGMFSYPLPRGPSFFGLIQKRSKKDQDATMLLPACPLTSPPLRLAGAI